MRTPAAVAVGLLLLGATACGAGNPGTSGTGGAAAPGLIVGTTDKVVSIDPAGAYDRGSSTIHTQVHSYLLGFPPGETTPQPDAAESCEFTKPTEYTCTMKDGLTFANGHDLTASDVAFSFQRIVDIADPNGPSSLLNNMKSVEAPDDSTVVFTLNEPTDQTFPQVLATSAGPIVDEEVYPADEVLADEEIVAQKATAGPYTITEYQKNQLAEFEKNPDYQGIQGEPKNDRVAMKYYTDQNNLKLEIENKSIDVAWRSLSPTDIENLEQTDGLTVYKGAGGESRYIVFNLKTMPGKTDDQKLAIRKALASLVDRQALSEKVYKGTYVPEYSPVPEGQLGATTPFAEMYGEEPDPAAAEEFLSEAGVKTPVEFDLWYNPDHYGSSSAEEYNELKRQFEADGLFKINLQSAEWTTYNEERVKDTYPIYQLGWFPDFPDPDTYLSPFFSPNNFVGNHYEDPEMTKLLKAQRGEPDEAKRVEVLGKVQQKVAEQIPILPLLTGAQVAVATDEVKGVQSTLDPAFKFRFSSLEKVEQ